MNKSKTIHLLQRQPFFRIFKNYLPCFHLRRRLPLPKKRGLSIGSKSCSKIDIQISRLANGIDHLGLFDQQPQQLPIGISFERFFASSCFVTFWPREPLWEVVVSIPKKNVSQQVNFSALKNEVHHTSNILFGFEISCYLSN